MTDEERLRAEMQLRVLWSRMQELSELPIRLSVPKASGVYVLWSIDPSTNALGCLYVGSAQDLSRRLLDHLSGVYRTRGIGALEDGDVEFQYAPLEPADTRRHVVNHLVRELRPRGNRRTGLGVNQVVNLPVPHR